MDRLLDDTSAGGAERLLVSADSIKDSVAADVERLLNTRKPGLGALLAGAGLADQSVTNFGLEDFSSMSVDSSADRENICAAIVRALRTFEPRLKSVVVSLIRDDLAVQRLRFSIRALLVLHPMSEPVNFDAVLQTATQNYTVKPARRVD